MKFANHLGYSDINPYEVIRVISEKTIDVREMKAELDPSYKPEFVPGGFSVICLNDGKQKWIIESDESKPVKRIRLSKNKGWQDAHGHRFKLADRPVKYYDHNF